MCVRVCVRVCPCVCVCAVTLLPFDYDPTDKYKHKFMVQSIIVPAAATQQDIDNMVCDNMRQFSDVFLLVFVRQKLIIITV